MNYLKCQMILNKASILIGFYVTSKLISLTADDSLSTDFWSSDEWTEGKWAPSIEHTNSFWIDNKT